MLNCAACAGDVELCLETVGQIKRQFQVDAYTVSILMQGSRKSKRAGAQLYKLSLELLDSIECEITSDEVLLTTVVEACIMYKDLPRLDQILAAYRKSELRISTQMYGTLIK